MIYSPAEDSFLLKSVLSKYVKSKSVLDIGAGSGILALSAIESGASSVTASDINLEAIKELKQKNTNIKIIKSNLFEKIKEKFDIIIFNPPYLPIDNKEDSESALTTTSGKKGDELIIKFLKQAPEHLNKNGIILLLASSLTPMSGINKLMKELKLTVSVIAQKKLFFESLFVFEIKKAKL